MSTGTISASIDEIESNKSLVDIFLYFQENKLNEQEDYDEIKRELK